MSWINFYVLFQQLILIEILQEHLNKICFVWYVKTTFHATVDIHVGLLDCSG